MEDEVDGDCQDNQVDNAHRRGAKVDRDRHGQFGRDRNDANDDCGLGHWLGLDFKGEFHGPE